MIINGYKCYLTDEEFSQLIRFRLRYSHYDAYKDVDLFSYFLKQKQKENEND